MKLSKLQKHYNSVLKDTKAANTLLFNEPPKNIFKHIPKMYITKSPNKILKKISQKYNITIAHVGKSKSNHKLSFSTKANERTTFIEFSLYNIPCVLWISPAVYFEATSKVHINNSYKNLFSFNNIDDTQQPRVSLANSGDSYLSDKIQNSKLIVTTPNKELQKVLAKNLHTTYKNYTEEEIFQQSLVLPNAELYIAAQNINIKIAELISNNNCNNCTIKDIIYTIANETIHNI